MKTEQEKSLYACIPQFYHVKNSICTSQLIYLDVHMYFLFPRFFLLYSFMSHYNVCTSVPAFHLGAPKNAIQQIT